MTGYHRDPPMPVAGQAQQTRQRPSAAHLVYATGRSEPPLFARDSLVVVTARELLAAHTAPPGAPCPVCGVASPCPTRENAMEVCDAAGVAAPPAVTGRRRAA